MMMMMMMMTMMKTIIIIIIIIIVILIIITMTIITITMLCSYYTGTLSSASGILGERRGISTSVMESIHGECLVLGGSVPCWIQ